MSFQAWRPLLGVLVLGVVATGARVLSFEANETPHGDVAVSAMVAESVHRGDGLVIPCRWLRTYPTSEFEGGMPMDGQPPLWPLLAAPLVGLIGDGFTAVKVLSLLSGLALLPVSFFAFRRLLGEREAWLVVFVLGLAVVMIDYSANGSLYSLLAILFVSFAARLVEIRGPAHGVVLGALIGAGMLLHQGAIVLFAVLWLRVAIGFLRGEPRRPLLVATITAVATAALVMLPWWIRNARLFGDPFFQSHTLFVLHQLGVPWRLLPAGPRDLVVAFDTGHLAQLHTIKVMLSWLVENGAFLIGQILILVPVLSLLALVQALHVFRKRTLAPATVGLVVTPLLYGLIACGWPVFQYRCLVPLLPFVCALGAAAVFSLRASRLRTALVVISVAGVVTASTIAITRVPTHTYYFGPGEALFQRKEAELRTVARVLDTLEPDDVMSSELNLYVYTPYPWTFLPPGMSESEMRRFVATYEIRYVAAEVEEARRYRDAFAVRTHHEGSYWVLLEILDDGPLRYTERVLERATDSPT